MDERSPIFGAEPERIDKLLAWPRSSDAQDPSVAPIEQFAEGPGAQIGRYRLLRVLGEGGMGIIYLAKQIEPVRREVALKILKPGMDSCRVIARFEVEQQALALMEHLYIARVYDAGVAPSGRPYFVMEHVRGLSITEHCDRHGLTIEQRLNLFLHVCEAIQHAHQKGIIHRDLKPSNILVAIQDEQAIPKVIDFGVARAIGEPFTTRTLFTEQGQFIGTPEYMSPEQADIGNEDIDTRTDIYSLGVVLYELLAGVLPFDPGTFRDGGIEHIRKVICEEEPKTPSSRVRTPRDSTGAVAQPPSAVESRGSPPRAGVLPDVARRRQMDVRMLQRKLHGDLDWITLKAMEKDRTRRYATVDAMAADIRNYLNHQPVGAAPPGLLYRASKFTRRHRPAITGAGTALLLLLVLFWAARTHLQAGMERARAQRLEHGQILSKAREQHARRDSGAALETLKPVLDSRHVGSEAQLLLAGILVEHRYYDQATPRLEKLVDKPPEIAGAAYALLARVAWEGPSLGPEELKKADAYQKKAEALRPRTTDAYYLRAMAALTIPEKRDLLAEALRLDPSHYESRRLRALTHQASRKYDLLEHDAWVMMDRWPRDPLGYSLRAVALKELGKYQEAIECYNSALERTAPGDPEYIRLNEQRGGVLLRMGEYERILAEAQAGAKGRSPLQCQVFCALTAVGRYEEAIALYQRIAKSDSAAGAQLGNQSMKYVFDVLDAGRAWHPLDSKPDGPAFLPMVEAEETYRSLSAKGHRLMTDCFSATGSPDGTKMALALGPPGNSGLAIYDPVTKETDLLIVPGKDPSWSPDGRRIAFVRDYTVLRLSEFVTGESKPGNHIYFRGEEVWVMNKDGTQPRRLARGAGFPSWSRDGKQVYYQSRMEHMLCSISVDDPQAKPVQIFPCFAYYPTVSPEGNCVAHSYQGGEAISRGVLRITDLASRSLKAEWAAPLVMYGGYWSPDGRELALLSNVSGTVSTGLWIYDMDKKEAAKVFCGPIVHATWSPDKRQLLFRLGAPYHEMWVADLDPSLSTAEALGPARTLAEHCRECIAACNRQLEADPNQRVSHLERTASALWINDDRASAYLRELDSAFDRSLPAPLLSYANAQQILYCPPLRDRLMPLALILAGKTLPHCARDLAHMLCHLGQDEQAVALWPRVADSVPRGNCRYDEGSQSYTVVASGHDLYGTLDDLHFAGKSLAGDGSITARIDSIENVNEWTSAGIAIRSSLEPDCPGVLLVVTPAGRLYYRHRLAENEVSYSVDMPPNTIQLPHWLRLIRRGDCFTALHSSDGVVWEDVLFGSEQQSSIRIAMDETACIGLAVNSRDLTKTAEARISHVTTTGNVSPPGPFTESQDIRFQLPAAP